MMHLDDLEIHVLGDYVKAVHGDDVYTAALHRALAIASRESVRASQVHEPGPAGTELSQTGLTTEAVLAIVRTEFMKLLRPN